MKTSNAVSSAIVGQLPDVVHTRGGTPFQPNDDRWKWTEGVFTVSLDYTKLSLPQSLKASLKRTLATFAAGSSPSHLQNLFSVFKHFLEHRDKAAPLSSITVLEVSNYSANLKNHEKWRFGTLNVLLQKWAALNLPGLEPGCATYMEDRRKPGNVKGAAVRTRNPVLGPFSESEYTAIYKAVDAAYGQETTPLWVAVLTRLLFASGGRTAQYASLKILDFNDSKGQFILSLPQVKQRGEHSRQVFKDFELSPQTGRLIQKYIADLKLQGFTDNDALFPERIVMTLGPKEEHRAKDDIFYGHCARQALSRVFIGLAAYLAPPTERLDFAPTPITPQRFRYTFGTRLVEEGASQVVVADRLGHTDLQNAGVYYEASPKILDNIDRAMDAQLAPLAAAFRGRLIKGEEQSTHKGAPGSRIIDFRVSTQPIASCAGKSQGCSFNKPVACYSCFKFEPWLDAPHEKVLARLEAEREKHAGDERIARVNDDAILAVKQVIAECALAREQHMDDDSEGAA